MHGQSPQEDQHPHFSPSVGWTAQVVHSIRHLLFHHWYMSQIPIAVTTYFFLSSIPFMLTLYTLVWIYSSCHPTFTTFTVIPWPCKHRMSAVFLPNKLTWAPESNKMFPGSYIPLDPQILAVITGNIVSFWSEREATSTCIVLDLCNNGWWVFLCVVHRHWTFQFFWCVNGLASQNLINN